MQEADHNGLEPGQPEGDGVHMGTPGASNCRSTTGSPCVRGARPEPVGGHLAEPAGCELVEVRKHPIQLARDGVVRGSVVHPPAFDGAAEH